MGGLARERLETGHGQARDGENEGASVRGGGGGNARVREGAQGLPLTRMSAPVISPVSVRRGGCLEGAVVRSSVGEREGTERRGAAGEPASQARDERPALLGGVCVWASRVRVGS